MKPKKYLGQNFLRDKKILERIIKSADLKPDDLVMEVGPGEGVLTRELTAKANKIIAIEKDASLAEKLAANFQFSIYNFQSISNDSILNFKNKAAIISADILKVNLPEIIKQNDFLNYKVIANIPYYITSPIIQLFLETKIPPTEMILMVQKEVAERICAKPGEMSILAVSVQYYAGARILFNVSKDAFYPVPEVDSAVIKISVSRKQGTAIDKEETKKFFRVVKAGFSSRRKTLLNNLANSFHIGKDEVEEKLKKVPLNGTVRAQELSVDDWKKLSRIPW